MFSTRERELMWAPVDSFGLEHLRLTLNYQGAVAGGLVLGLKYGVGYRAHYVVRSDSAWRVREVRLMMIGSADPPLTLLADGDGHWTSGDGDPIPKLDGCIDVDLSVTPYTNTLPIRRLKLEPGEMGEINVAYLRAPDLALEPSGQRYTCLERDPEGSSIYRFESLDGDFSADLAVDADGLVIDYPGLFRRTWSR